MFRQPTRRDFLKAATASAVLSGGACFAQTIPPAALKKAVLTSMLPETLSWVERFKLAARVGFTGLEAQTTVQPDVVEEIKEAAKTAGLKIHAVMNMDHWKYPLSSADPAVVAKSMAGMETSLRNAKVWGADVVLLVPAVVNPQTSYRDAYTRSQKQIRQLIPLAKELGVIIAVEEVWNKFLLSPLEFARYVDELDSPWVKAYFDVGNVVLFGFPQDWIRTLGKRIVRIHLKDFKSETRQFVPLREGSINWPEVRKALDEVGYRGFLTVELNEGDENYLKEVSARVDQIIAGA
jgi:hexulose-6-phosphate isomerase